MGEVTSSNKLVRDWQRSKFEFIALKSCMALLMFTQFAYFGIQLALAGANANFDSNGLLVNQLVAQYSNDSFIWRMTATVVVLIAVNYSERYVISVQNNTRHYINRLLTTKIIVYLFIDTAIGHHLLLH